MTNHGMTNHSTTGHSMRRLPFQYVVLRCVPRVDREEFLNVGVVLYSQQADYLACASHVEEQRLLTLAPDLDIASVQSALDALAAICAGTGPSAFISLGQRFGWIVAPKSTMIQPGPVHGGLTENPEIELPRLLDMLVR